MWSDLVQAYESKLAVLEEARAAYSRAVADVIGYTDPAMEAAVRGVIAGVEDECRVESSILKSGDDATLDGAPWSCITITDDTTGTEFRVAAWVASSWGGPEGVLRVGLSLEKVRDGLDLREWAAKCRECIAESAPGEPFDPLDWLVFPDSGPEWTSIRIASISLLMRDLREAARDASEVAAELAREVPALLTLIRDAGMALTVAEDALLRYRPALEARAEQLGQTLSPTKDLGPWMGGRYLQIASFWLGTNPDANELVAAANKEDREVVARLSERLGRPAGRRGASPAVVVLEERQLRDPECDVDEAVREAFEVWFEVKSESPDEPPGDEPV
jgi:hypothetical protein